MAADTPSWSLQDAKNRFSHVVEAARQGAPQFVTRRGRPAVVVLAAEDYERLARRQAPSFAAHLLAMPRSNAGGGRSEGRSQGEPTPLALRDVSFDDEAKA